MNKQTKKPREGTKTESKMELESNKDELTRLGTGIKAQLDSHFKQWNAGLPFKTIISKHSVKAKSMSLSVDELAMELEANGYIKVLSTPTGRRYVFSGTVPLEPDELNDLIQMQESIRESSK